MYAECMQNRGLVLHEPLFDTEMDLLDGAGQVPLIDAANSIAMSVFEQQLSQSFHQIRWTWALAARLMRAICTFGRTSNSIDPQLFSGTRPIASLTLMYSQFTACLDDMPRVLQPPVVFGQNDATVTDSERQCYISQRYRLLSAYYYAKLRVIHECKYLGLASVVGLRDDDATIEVMRAVGSIMLAITRGSDHAIIRQRALAHLNVLVDILARLDSQASEKLTSQLPHPDRLLGGRRA